VFIPAIWKVVVPPKVQLFLWLLSHNKLATVDNLKKRGAINLNNAVFSSRKRVLCTYFLNVWLLN
jgi:hypothetical protein